MAHARTLLPQRLYETALCLLLCVVAPAAAEDPRNLLAEGTLVEEGTLIVATFPQATSHFSRPGENGGYAGFDVDMMTTFAKRLGLQLELFPVAGYDELIPALQNGQADVVASSFSITEARLRFVDFSDPYFPVLVQAVVPEDSSIRSIEDLRGRTGSALAGSEQERAMNEIGGITILYLQSSLEHWEALRSGAVDFAFLDSTSVFRDRDKSQGTRVAFSLPEVSNYGCAFPKGSDLKRAFDAHLASIRSTNYLYALVRRHFGEDGVAVYRLASGSAED